MKRLFVLIVLLASIASFAVVPAMAQDEPKCPPGYFELALDEEGGIISPNPFLKWEGIVTYWPEGQEVTFHVVIPVWWDRNFYETYNFPGTYAGEKRCGETDGFAKLVRKVFTDLLPFQ